MGTHSYPSCHHVKHLALQKLPHVISAHSPITHFQQLFPCSGIYKAFVCFTVLLLRALLSSFSTDQHYNYSLAHPLTSPAPLSFLIKSCAKTPTLVNPNTPTPHHHLSSWPCWLDSKLTIISLKWAHGADKQSCYSYLVQYSSNLHIHAK